jgi:hypothetical protein
MQTGVDIRSEQYVRSLLHPLGASERDPQRRSASNPGRTRVPEHWHDRKLSDASAELDALRKLLGEVSLRLPPAVTNDARCEPLHNALAQLRSSQHSTGNKNAARVLYAPDLTLAAARVALEVLAGALAGFASDLRTSHLCRMEAQEARKTAEAAAAEAQHAANTYRSKRDDAVKYGQVCLCS